MLMSSPVMRCLKKNGVHRVDVIAYDFCVPILEKNPYIDNIYPVKKHAWWQAIKAGFRRYDLVMQLNTSFKTNLLLLLAGNERLGYSYKWKGLPLTIKVPLNRRTATRGNRVRECLNLLAEGLGFNCDNEDMIYYADCD